MLSTLRDWFSPGRARRRAQQRELKAVAGEFARFLNARYDAAQTTALNQNHWAGADSLGPKSANSPHVRRTLRMRARYEADNNSWCAGILRTLACHTIGSGPRLQLLSQDSAANARVERAWHRWATGIGLHEKLIVSKVTEARDGEWFAMLANDPASPVVPLNVRPFEPDQCALPWHSLNDPSVVDGIRMLHDRPVEYFVLDQHPGDLTRHYMTDGRWYPADQVLHYFAQLRPGQVRGVPEITPALPLFALLRRFTLATIHSAESAALFAMFLKTTMAGVVPAEDENPFAAMAVERNMMTTLPEGWEVQQLKPEHPATTFDMFQRAVLNEIARCLSIPYNIAACNSAGYNYSSGRLDHQTYYRAIELDRCTIEARTMNPIWRAWCNEAVYVPGLLDGLPPLDQVDHQWMWDGQPAIDEENEAAANKVRLSSGETTIAIVQAKAGLDPEKELAREAAYFGVTVEALKRSKYDLIYGEGAAAKAFEPPPEPGTAAIPGGGAYSEISRLQWKRNRKAITDVLDELARGEITRTAAVALLKTLGLPPTDAEFFVADKLNDGQVNDPSLEQPTVQAAGETDCDFAAVGTVAFSAGAEDATGSKPCEVLAYTGDELNVSAFPHPAVVDFAGLQLPATVPFLADHKKDTENTLGQGEPSVEGGQLWVRGVITPVTTKAQQIVAMARQGHRWQASIGTRVVDAVDVAPGQVVRINGREFTGPIVWVKKSLLREVSLLPNGADPHTSVSIAASAATGAAMSFEDWVASLGFDAATLTPPAKEFLMSQYTLQQGQQPPVDAAAKKPEQPAVPAVAASAGGAKTLDATADITAYRAEIAAEKRRVAELQTVCQSYPDIMATAIEKGWDKEKTEFAVKARNRPAAPATHVIAEDKSPQVIEAAMLLACDQTLAEKHFDEKTLTAANRFNKQGIGLKRVLLEAAWANGCGERFVHTGNLKTVLQAAFPRDLEAGFTVLSLPGIFANTANKFLLAGFDSVEDTWKKIASVNSVNDFKAMTFYRLLDGGDFAEVGPTGELQHARFDEQTFTNQARTYGRIGTLTRQDIINDDLGALNDMPFRIGRQGALKFNDVFWRVFLDNSAFFTLALGNYMEGANTALSSASLSAAEVLFDKMVDPLGVPVSTEPKMLLTPTELFGTNRELYTSQNVTTGGASTVAKQPSANIHQGKYEPIKSRYLSAAGYPGNSATAWYLLADPKDAATINAVFLDGKQTPTVEDADANFETLGVQIRGYWDFGIARRENRGGVKAKGVA